MNKEEHVTTWIVKSYQEDLTPDEKELMDMAIKATGKAYAPYSGFRVGAAIRLSDGKLVTGANQENSSYPLCMCGERVALYAAAMVMDGEKIMDLAITVRSDLIEANDPVSPCGACRQVIVEFEGRQQQNIRILLKGTGDKIYEFNSGSSLLPLKFEKKHLLGDH